MYDNPERDWENVRLYVKPGLTESKYNSYTALGQLNARRYLRQVLKQDPVPSLDHIKAAHKYVFGKVYDFAGQFRHGDQHPGIGDRGDKIYFEPAFTGRIEYEFDRLATYMRDLLAKAPSTHTKAEVIALYHSQYERIHAFRDGNGRTGRLIMEAQVEHILGYMPQEVVQRKQYLEGLWQAHIHGQLADLTYAITGKKLDPNQLATSYHRELWPVFLEKTTTLGDTFKVQCPDIDTALDITAAVLTPRLERYIRDHGTRELGLDFDNTQRPPKLDLARTALRHTRPRQLDRDDLTRER